jgi:hypothetical protein
MKKKKASDLIKLSGLQKSDVRNQKSKHPSGRAKTSANLLGAFLPSSGRAAADSL